MNSVRQNYRASAIIKTFSFFGLLVLLLSLSIPASARTRYAELVIDAKNGQILAARNANARKYPASLTKIMTLYLLFEALEKGDLSLNQKIKTSRRAAGQPASKLGLKRGDLISVKQAIMGLVTKSANDVATAIAEAISGSEFKFALKMTQRARDLGMSKTTFRNASGLPNRRQLSTARDMARLALAIHRDFPQYFLFFSKTSFSFKGKVFQNHNNLIGTVNGVDGIKTGYIRASGFNLVATASRKNERVVGVLFGGRTAGSRDRRMQKLLAIGFNRLKAGVKRNKKEHFVLPRGRMDGFGQVPAPPKKPSHNGRALVETKKYNVKSNAAWSIQIGSFDKAASARRQIHKLNGVLPKLMLRAKTSVDAIQSGKSIFYRARVREMNKYQAHSFCRQIRLAKFDCLIIAPLQAIRLNLNTHIV